MKKILMMELLSVVTGVTVMVANAKDEDRITSEMPVVFEATELRFYKYTDEKSKITEVKKEQEEAEKKTKDVLEKSKKTKINAEASAGISHEFNAYTISGKAGLAGGGGIAGGGMLGPLPLGGAMAGVGAGGVGFAAGVASSKTKIDLNARLTASHTMENSHLRSEMKEVLEAARKSLMEDNAKSSGNWFFSVKGRLINRNQRKYVCKDVKNAKVFVHVMGYSIDVNLKDTQGFTLIESVGGATSKEVEFEREIKEDDYKAALLASKISGILSPQICTVTVEKDFPLVDGKDGKFAFHSQDVNPITVDVRFGKYAECFPICIKSIVERNGAKHEVTVKEALTGTACVIHELNQGNILGPDRVFQFEGDKLKSVFQKEIGVLDSTDLDKSGYKMVLMRQGRIWKHEAGKDELLAVLGGDDTSRMIVFDQIGVLDIAEHPDEFSLETKRMFADQVSKREKEKKSLRGQLDLGCLYGVLEDQKKMIECLAEASSQGLRLTDFTLYGAPAYWTVILKGSTNDITRILGKDVNSNQMVLQMAQREFDNLQDTNGRTVLSLVIEQDDVEKYKLLKREGINKIEGYGTRHLFAAAKFGSINIVKYLVEEARERYREEGTKKVLEEVVEAVDDNGWTPLMLAAHEGKFDVCRYLIDNGADVDRKRKEDKTKVDELCDENRNQHEVICKYIRAMRKLKEQQSSIWGKPEYTHDSILKDYIPAGIPVDYRWNFTIHDEYHAGDEGWTFLHWALDENDVGLVKELIKKGSDVNASYHGELPLCYAISKKRWNLVKALLQAPHVNVRGWKDRKGRDSEYLVIDKVDEPELLKLFLGNVEDEKREKLLDYARKTKKAEAENVLKK